MSLDPHYYDKYCYDVVVHPDGVLKGNGAINVVPIGKSLKPLLMNTPNNFRQFPRQKYYFELEKITTGTIDLAALVGNEHTGTIGLFENSEFLPGAQCSRPV